MSDKTETLLNQAQSNILAGNNEQALELLIFAEKLSGNEQQILAKVCFQMAKCYAALRKDKLVVDYLDKALELDPSIADETVLWVDELYRTSRPLGKQISKKIRSIQGTPEPRKIFTFSKKSYPWILAFCGILILGLLSIMIVFGINESNNTIVRLDVERIRSNVGQVYVLARWLDDEDSTIITFPIFVGSCFAVSENGYLLTNRHVTDAYMEIKDKKDVLSAILHVGFGKDPSDRYEAEIIHESPTFDAALLKIDRYFKHPLRDIAKVQVGDQVFTCGFPKSSRDLALSLDINNVIEKLVTATEQLRREGETDYFKVFPDTIFDVTVSTGIISSIRDIGHVTWFQTDAAMHPGNSGGPTVLTDCQLVGINTLGHKEHETTNYILSAQQLKDEFVHWVKFR